MTSLFSPAPTTPPRVFVAMPVYNEEQHLHDALTDLVNQDYTNFTILISDNASTDRTETICRQFTKDHPMVEYQRMEQNLGSSENFRRVMAAAEGSYFVWASGHDRWAHNYLSECVKTLETHPDAAIAFGTGSWIGPDGEPLARQSGWTDTRGMNRIARYFSVIWGNMHPILGVIRLNYLRSTGGVKAITGSDLVMLTELVLMGDFIHATDTHWSRRENRGEEVYADKLKRYRGRQFGLTHSRISQAFPLAALPIALFRAVLRAKLSVPEKLSLCLLLPGTFLIKYLSVRWQRPNKPAKP